MLQHLPPAGMQQMTLQSRSAKIIRSVVDVPVMTHGRFGDVDKKIDIKADKTSSKKADTKADTAK